MYVRAEDDSNASVKVSDRVRDIVTRNLASPDADWPASDAAVPGVEQLTEEIRVLQVSVFVFDFFIVSK